MGHLRFEKVAKDFPTSTYAYRGVSIFRTSSVIFKEHERSFLVGCFGCHWRLNRHGWFYWWLWIFLLSVKFGCGYEQGVKYASSCATVFSKIWQALLVAAFNDPTKGSETAKSFSSLKAQDVVFAAVVVRIVCIRLRKDWR